MSLPSQTSAPESGHHDRFRIVIDVDSTLSYEAKPGQSYADLDPNPEVVATLRRYREQGFYIIVSTARNMRTYQNNVGKINAHTLPVLLDWLTKHEIPFDEVHVAKPWCGFDGFYVDDKSIRPDEFVNKSYDEILALIGTKRK
jgi:capsule biosynthesis phosphatase